MKKLLLISLLLLLAVSSYAQEVRRVYTQISVVVDGEERNEFADNTIIFNYENKGVVKMLMKDFKVSYFDPITAIKTDKTSNGTEYKYATYSQRETGMTIIIMTMLNYSKCAFLLKDDVNIYFY